MRERERVQVVGGGNLRQEAWSVRRSHPTAFHREATLIADVLEATMDVGHDDCSETYVGGGWKDTAPSIQSRIFIFLTLSLTVRRSVPTSSSHSHPSTPVWMHFFLRIATSLSARSPAALFFFFFFFVLDYQSSRFFPRNNTRRKSHDDDEAFVQRR